MTAAQPYIGSSVLRSEDSRFTTGAGTYVDDIKIPGALHAAILRSPHGHARITSIDTSKALEIAGSVKVFTFQDLGPNPKPIPMRMMPLPGLERFLQYPLAGDEVRYVGEPLAVVIAESRYIAEDMLDAVQVTYQSLDAVVDAKEALKDLVLIHEGQGTNLAASHQMARGDVERAFRNAEYTRKEEFKINRHTGVPLETRGLVASYDGESGDLTVWGPTKVPHFNRGVLSSLLDMPEEKIHLIEPDVGGGFGIRGEFHPEDYLIPFVSMRLERPVKWIEDRREHLMAANHSREMYIELEIATKRDGTILGMRGKILADIGAYTRTHGGLVPNHTAMWLPGPYRVSDYECHIYFIITNKMGVGTYRGPGAFESCFARERLLDMVASDLGLDPVEFRLKNLLQPSELPYESGFTDPMGKTLIYDTGNYPSAFKKALEVIDYDSIKALQGVQKDGKYHGIGIATFVKLSGLGPFENARLVLKGSRETRVYLGVSTLGQGHETIMAQICGDTLGISMEAIKVFHGNTDQMARGVGTFGGRVTAMAGSAVYLAAQKLKARVLSLASTHLEIPEDDLDLLDGRVCRRAGGTEEPVMDLDGVVELSKAAGEFDPEESGIVETGYFETDSITCPYGTHVAHVTVDPETGVVDILRYVTVHDVGHVINPMLVQGQIVGGIVQGLGAALLEDLVYDENGQLLTTTFMDYLLPTSQDVPPIESIVLDEAPSSQNPLGVKGAGEVGIVCPGAVIGNAVSNALARFGVQVRDLPLSPDRVRAMIRAGQSRKP